MKYYIGIICVLVLLCGAASASLGYQLSNIQYQRGLEAGEWKGKAETYQGIMDQQVRTMEALRTAK